jgi:hypothetical protein
VLTGTAGVDELAQRLSAATIPAWASDGVELEGVISLQIIAELRRAGREALLPAGLHPTDPPSLHLQVWRVEQSPWGPFVWAHTRLSCRSGVRARALTTASVVDQPGAATGLAERFGFPSTVASIRLDVFYDRSEARVEVEGRAVLEVDAVDPTPMAPDAVQSTSTMNLGLTPQGFRLVQVEARHHTTGIDRLRARIRRFDPAAWGDDRLDPYNVVSAVQVRDQHVTLPPVRFVCRPDVSAFEGTERVGNPGA